MLAFLAGCAGSKEQDLVVNDDPGVAAAQVQDDDAGFEEEDSGFEDLVSEDDEAALEEDYDPLEIPNRFIFAFNEMLDTLLLQPAAATYRFLLPEFVRDSVQSFMRNLKAPVILANDIFQGKFGEAGDTAARFAINTTVGVGGLIDLADYWGIPYREEDFGQTLGSYGLGPGPYLVLPLLGPSSLRDGVGRGVDSALSPWNYILAAAEVENIFAISVAQRGLEGIDLRSRNIETIDEIKRDAIDYYARVRSLYLQLRRSQIKDTDREETEEEDVPNGDELSPTTE